MRLVVQSKQKLNLFAAPGVAVREYQTDTGLADYILFVDRQPVGVIEAKREEDGFHLTFAEIQRACGWLRDRTPVGVCQALARIGIAYKRARSYIHSPDPIISPNS